MAGQINFKKIAKKSFVYLASALGALGTGLQNYMAVAQLIKDLLHAGFASTHAGFGIIHGVAVGLGAICSGLVNFFINVELLKSFWKRLRGKSPKPDFSTPWTIPFIDYQFDLPIGLKKFLYYAGSVVFVVTGILFGLTAFAFGPVGPLVAAGIAAGIFVALIMTIQELETWLQSFEPKAPEAKPTEPVEKSKTGKIFGHVIAIGNVLALSLLFMFAIATFLSGVGVAMLPAVIIGFAVAFTFGAFTEFYFYNYFISNFCEKIQSMWKQFWDSKNSVLGFIASLVNAGVNGVLSFVGIMAIIPLLTAASIAVPPIGVIIVIAATASVFAALASFFLGLEFWRLNYKPEPAAAPVTSSTDSYSYVQTELQNAAPAPTNQLEFTPAPDCCAPAEDIDYSLTLFGGSAKAGGVLAPPEYQAAAFGPQ